MTFEQAMSILEQLANQVSSTKAGHQQIAAALAYLRSMAPQEIPK